MGKSFDRGLMDFLYRYSWPGNVRELANLVERLMLTVPSKVLKYEDLPEDYRRSEAVLKMESPMFASLHEAVEHAEKKMLLHAIETATSTYDIAQRLGTSQPTVVRKLKKYKLTVKSDTKMNR